MAASWPHPSLADRPRYSRRDLPPYSYVPGRFPHPASDPAGHSFGAAEAPPTAFDAADWQTNETWRYAVDLFNHGYYWEAHEQWEALWHAAGRRGTTADWLKGLIKLAAAGVKLREGNLRGMQRHAVRAEQLLLAGWKLAPSGCCGGMDVQYVVAAARAASVPRPAAMAAPHSTAMLECTLTLTGDEPAL